MEAQVPVSYVPYTVFTAHYTDTSGLLKLTFPLVNKLPPVVDDCGDKLIRTCDHDVLLPVTAATINWKICSGVYVVKDTDTDPNFTVTLIQDVNNQVVSIQVEIASPYVKSKNDFALFGTINGVETLLMRGRIYVGMDISEVVNLLPLPLPIGNYTFLHYD